MDINRATNIVGWIICRYYDYGCRYISGIGRAKVPSVCEFGVLEQLDGWFMHAQSTILVRTRMEAPHNDDVSTLPGVHIRFSVSISHLVSIMSIVFNEFESLTITLHPTKSLGETHMRPISGIRNTTEDILISKYVTKDFLG